VLLFDAAQALVLVQAFGHSGEADGVGNILDSFVYTITIYSIFKKHLFQMVHFKHILCYARGKKCL